MSRRGKWTRRPDGRYVRQIGDKLVYRSRYVWERFNGPIPKGYHIDHINGNPSYDAPHNLQAVPPLKNYQLRSPTETSATSGFPNVYRMWNGKWYGQFRNKYKRIHCGVYDTPEEAYEAVQRMRKQHGVESRRLARTGQAPTSRREGQDNAQAGRLQTAKPSPVS